MKLLIYSQNYAPEEVGVAKYNAEMVEFMVEKGVEVRVVCPPPYYPERRVREGWSAYRYVREESAGVVVKRCPMHVFQAASGAKRVLTQVSFGLSSLPVLLRELLVFRPDIVFLTEPPIFCAPSAALFGRMFQARTWLHIQDFEIDAALSLGLLKGRGLSPVIGFFERLLMNSFHVVSSISPAMQRKALEKGVLPKKMLFFPNWVDLDFIRPGEKERSTAEALGIPMDRPIAFYSGTMGRKHGMEIICKAAERLHAEGSDVFFVLCGQGAAREELETLMQGLDNVLFLELQPLEIYKKLLNIADIHLLPQRPDVEELVLPSKLTAILSCGGAFVTTARPGSDLANIAETVGAANVPPGDAEAFTEAVRSLAADAGKRAAIGERARAYAEEHLQKERILEDVLDAMKRSLVLP
jgi:colanic acid biosynthesis glycosyl transferase WcaI